MKLCSKLFSFLAGKLNLQAWLGAVKVMAKSEVELEEPVVDPHSRQEDCLSHIQIVFNPAHIVMPLELLSICGELLLRINELQHLSLRPPSLACHHIHSIRLDFLNQLLSPLSEHCALIHCANQVNLLAIEPLS